MAEHYSFFDPVETEQGFDREYNAQEFTDYFKSLVTTGVMKGAGSELKVTANGSNMVSEIETGIAFVDGRYYSNTSKLVQTHDTEVLGKDRIDRIVVRLDLNTEARHVKSFVKKGVASVTPVAPSLTRDVQVYEISLAQVKVIGGQTYINVTDVVDERGQEAVCPWAGSKILPNFNNAELENLVNGFNNHIKAYNPHGITPEMIGAVKVGINGTVIHATGDWNNIGKTGFYDGETTLNAPPTKNDELNWWYVIVLSHSSDPAKWTIQLAWNFNSGRHMARIKIGGTWNPWQEPSGGLDDLKVRIGAGAVASGDHSIAIGYQAEAKNVYSGIAIGNRAKNATAGVAIGQDANATGQFGGLVIGVGSSAGDQAIAIGDSVHASNTLQAILGNDRNIWTVPGSLSVRGGKNFEIPHPQPDKKHTHVIRHGAVESPTAGDTLYRYTIEATLDGEIVEVQLPDYFIHLNTNVDVWVNPYKHFGRAHGEVIGDKLLITCEKAGIYKSLVIGTRNDDNVQDWYIKGVEREIGESWLGEVYIFEVDEIAEISEFGEG